LFVEDVQGIATSRRENIITDEAIVKVLFVMRSGRLTGNFEA
jgi:hypothetical protein